MPKLIRFAAIFLPLPFLTTFVLAADQTPMELTVRSERYVVAYTLNPDGTHVEEREEATKILKERALEYAKRKSITYSTSVQKADILAAYTQKADGRKVEVSKDSYQLTVNSGVKKGAPAFSDYTTTEVIFPEVAVGDTVVLKYRITTIEPIFPGQFSVEETLTPVAAYDDVRLSIDYPTSLPVRLHATNLTLKTDEDRGNRHVTEWTYVNKAPMRPKRKDWSIMSHEDRIGFLASTFKGYQEIAEAYALRANPKAAVTARIKGLADEITNEAPDQREAAKRLYEWVARKITYQGNCVGIGAVVPRDLDFVLDASAGDCKDHDTVLRALLAARGIKAVSALINAGSAYRLDPIPVVSSVNHVITFIPEWNLFLDSTSDSTPFGWLPASDMDKPILLSEGYREGMRTPTLDSSKNREVAKYKFAIAEDGSIEGKMEVQLSGMYAIMSRANDRDISPESEAEMMKAYFDRDGSGFGYGKVEREDPKPFADTYRYSITFRAKDFLNLPGPGAMSTNAPFPTIAPVYGYFRGSMAKEEEAKEIICAGGATIEEIEFTLPKSMKGPTVPKDLVIKTPAVDYASTYKLSGRTLKIRHAIEDRTRGMVCPIAKQHAYVDLFKKVQADLRAQVVYK
jgi:transglutaminase-like putative cysteine protease